MMHRRKTIHTLMYHTFCTCSIISILL